MRNSPLLALCALPLLLASTSLTHAAAGSDDRLTFMASGVTLTDTDNGGGLAAGWLHNFTPDTLVGLGGEYESIGDAHWQFGILNLAQGLGQADHRTNLYAEARIGDGKDPRHDFNYQIVTAGVIQNLTHRFAIQLEDKQIDIDTSHGNVPKLGLQMLWSPQWLSSVSYAHSLGNNLGTRLGSLRVDYFGKGFNLLAGGAGGQASPALIDLQTGIRTPGQTLKEGFFGITRPTSRADLTLLGDYVKIGELKRVTVTLNATVRLRGMR